MNQRRNLLFGGGLLAAALAVVLVVVLASGGGGGGSSGAGPTAGKAALGGPETQELLGGIPQQGFTLGKASAPVTLIEFNDMQCPVCKQYDANVFGTLVDRYVRSGKLRLEMRLQSFIGPDSVVGGKAVAAAAQQDKAWDFEHLFYINQGTENTGYVTDAFLGSLAAVTKGLDTARLTQDRDGAQATTALETGDRDFKAAGFDATPSFLVVAPGGRCGR